MKIVKTDSLGIEILNKIILDESGDIIKLVKTKKKLINGYDDELFIVFEVYDQNKIIGYFSLKKETYVCWTKKYKLKGIEI
ncbi:MAG: hypothetical protein HRS50_00730 [Mycoplasmataceae bacterium]|nr:hypothetical protein [Mycoplasmataceae bacterium]